MESNFRQKQREEQEAIASSGAKTEVEFATPEDAIRHDVARNPPPPEIAERLNESLAAEPKRGSSFWSKLRFKK
jgi:hypothetical protein